MYRERKRKIVYVCVCERRNIIILSMKFWYNNFCIESITLYYGIQIHRINIIFIIYINYSSTYGVGNTHLVIA